MAASGCLTEFKLNPNSQPRPQDNFSENVTDPICLVLCTAEWSALCSVAKDGKSCREISIIDNVLKCVLAISKQFHTTLKMIELKESDINCYHQLQSGFFWFVLALSITYFCKLYPNKA